MQELDRPARDWLSALIIWGVALSPVIIGFTATAIDGGQYVRDSGHNRVWVSSGERAQLVRLMTVAAMTPLVLLLTVRGLLGGAHRWSLLGVCSIVVVLAEATRLGQSTPLTLVSILLGCTLLVFAANLRITPFVIRGLAVGLALICVALWLHYAIDPVASASPCRADKCSPIGGLMHGFFSHENTLGLYIASLIPTVAAVRSRGLRWGLVLLALSIILATGGRTPLASAVVGLVGMYLAAPFRGESPRTFSAWLRPLSWLPLVAFLTSATLFLVLPPEALTGRGAIYALVKRNLAEHLFLGPGPAQLLNAYENGQAGWVIAHEHGEAPHVLNAGGIVLFVLFVLALIQIGIRSWGAPGAAPIAFAVMPALGFLSEPTWMFDLRGTNFWAMLVTASLVTTCARARPPSRRTPRDMSATVAAV